MKKYVEKSAVVEAAQWKGDNLEEIKAMIGNGRNLKVHEDNSISFVMYKGYYIQYVNIGDYIVKRINGDLRRETAIIFEKSYEPYMSTQKEIEKQDCREFCLEELKKQLEFYAKNDYGLYFTPAFESTHWEYGNKYFDLYVGDNGYIDVLGLDKNEQEEIELFYKRCFRFR